MIHNNLVSQLFPQIEEIMVQPLRDSRDHYEELKQIDDAMTEVEPIHPSIYHMYHSNDKNISVTYIHIQYNYKEI